MTLNIESPSYSYSLLSFLTLVFVYMSSLYRQPLALRNPSSKERSSLITNNSVVIATKMRNYPVVHNTTCLTSKLNDCSADRIRVTVRRIHQDYMCGLRYWISSSPADKFWFTNLCKSIQINFTVYFILIYHNLNRTIFPTYFKWLSAIFVIDMKRI